MRTNTPSIVLSEIAMKLHGKLSNELGYPVNVTITRILTLAEVDILKKLVVSVFEITDAWDSVASKGRKVEYVEARYAFLISVERICGEVQVSFIKKHLPVYNRTIIYAARDACRNFYKTDAIWCSKVELIVSKFVNNEPI